MTSAPIAALGANLAVLPAVVPMAAGIAMVALHGRPRWQRACSAALALAQAVVAAALLGATRDGPVVLPVGNWPPPYAIVLAIDLFSAVMLSLAAVTYAAFVAFSWGALDRSPLDRDREAHFYWPLSAIQMMGVNGAFATGDIFNLFVMFEITLISSYILLALGGRPWQLQETLKYMAINIVASTLFLVAVAVLYSVFGTVNMADLAVKARAVPGHPAVTVAAIAFFLVFGLKGALFPLYAWLPHSYFFAPTGVSALFAGLLTKVGIYALIRVYTLIFTGDPGYTHEIVLAVAGFTMLFGVLGALAQYDMKLILSYHIISQIGYMAMGLGLFSPFGLTGAIYYIVHHIIVKSSLFFVAGATEQVTGTTDLRRMSGVLTTHPMLGVLFLSAGLSLAGIPPFSGFFSKYVLLSEGLAQGRWLIVTVSLIVSLLTLMSMIKIFRHAYWGPVDGERRSGSVALLVAPVLGLVLLSAGLGVGAEWAIGLSGDAAAQLVDPATYVRAVLGPEAWR